MALSETWNYYWTEMADPRTNDWPLVGSILPIPSLIFSYLYFVLRCGPNFMKDRQPYALKTFIRYYNIFQIITNALLVYNIFTAGWFTEISLGCEPFDYSYNPNPYKLAKVMWWAMLLKVFDFIETFVFVLRKKNNQISFLHLYHHVSTVVLGWLVTKYIPGTMSTFILMVNCSVHVIMYTYYLLSTMGPIARRLVSPIKPFITIIQMVQFWGLIIYISQGIMPSCNVPKLPAYVMLINLLINFILFYNFYQQNYKNKSNKKKL